MRLNSFKYFFYIFTIRFNESWEIGLGLNLHNGAMLLPFRDTCTADPKCTGCMTTTGPGAYKVRPGGT